VPSKEVILEVIRANSIYKSWDYQTIIHRWQKLDVHQDTIPHHSQHVKGIYHVYLGLPILKHEDGWLSM